MILQVSKVIALLCVCECVLGKGEEWANLGDFCRGFYDCITMEKENRNSWVKFLGQASLMLNKEIAKKRDNRGRQR